MEFKVYQPIRPQTVRVSQVGVQAGQIRKVVIPNDDIPLDYTCLELSSLTLLETKIKS